MNEFYGTKKVLLQVLMTTKRKRRTTVGKAVFLVVLMLLTSSYSNYSLLHSVMNGTLMYSFSKATKQQLPTTIHITKEVTTTRLSCIFLQRLFNYYCTNLRIFQSTIIHPFISGSTNGRNSCFVHSFQSIILPHNNYKKFYYNTLNFNNQQKEQEVYTINTVRQRKSEQNQQQQRQQFRHSKSVLYMMINSRIVQLPQQQQQVSIQWQPRRNWITTVASSSSSSSTIVTSTASSLYMSGGDEYDDEYKDTTATQTAISTEIDSTSTKTKTLDSVWNVPNMTKEINRCILRCHKKIGSIQQRINKVNDTIQQLLNNPQTTLQEYENSPDTLHTLQSDLQYWQQRLQSLNDISKMIDTTLSSKQKKTSIQLPIDIASLALSLNISDTTPTPPPRGTKVKNREKDAPRKPYRIYYSTIVDDNDNKNSAISSKDTNNNNNNNIIEIRVGKRAEDNDQLSINPEYRGSGNNWWMHASGCPGSHVVICTTNDIVPNTVLLDAASLAARYSKCFTVHNNYNSIIPVTVTRCKYITKPKLAQPGLVIISGPTQKLNINMKDAQQRIQRLETTVTNN